MRNYYYLENNNFIIYIYVPKHVRPINFAPKHVGLINFDEITFLA